MTALSKWLLVVSLALWLGTVVFFSFGVAPSVFAVLPRAQAGQLVSAVFPIYYGVGYGCGAVLVVSALILFRAGRPGGARWAATAVIASLMLAATLYAGRVVQPQAHTLRASLYDPNAPAAVKEDFDRLHRRAVQLNGAVLVGGLVISAITAASLRP